MLTLNTTPPLWQGPPKLFNYTTDHKFHDLVNEDIKLNTKLKTPTDIDSAVNSLTTIIQSATWSATNYDTNPLIHKPLPEIIRTKIVEKRKTRALYQRTRLLSHKHAYNHLANSLKKMLIKIKTKDFESHLINLLSKDGSFWRSTKHALNYKTQNLPIKKPDGSLASSDSEKAELFKAHLSATSQPHPDVFNANNMNTVETFLDSPLPLTLAVKPFTKNDVKYSLLHYSLKKSPGYDLITAESLDAFQKEPLST